MVGNVLFFVSGSAADPYISKCHEYSKTLQTDKTKKQKYHPTQHSKIEPVQSVTNVATTTLHLRLSYHYLPPRSCNCPFLCFKGCKLPLLLASGVASVPFLSQGLQLPLLFASGLQISFFAQGLQLTLTLPLGLEMPFSPFQGLHLPIS